MSLFYQFYFSREPLWNRPYCTHIDYMVGSISNTLQGASLRKRDSGECSPFGLEFQILVPYISEVHRLSPHHIYNRQEGASVFLPHPTLHFTTGTWWDGEKLFPVTSGCFAKQGVTLVCKWGVGNLLFLLHSLTHTALPPSLVGLCLCEPLFFDSFGFSSFKPCRLLCVHFLSHFQLLNLFPGCFWCRSNHLLVFQFPSWGLC